MATNVSSPYENSYGLKYKDGDVSLERREEQYEITSKSFFHTVLEGETIQSIAFQYYGDSGKWYRIAYVNSIYNPFTELEAGMEILIP